MLSNVNARETVPKDVKASYSVQFSTRCFLGLIPVCTLCKSVSAVLRRVFPVL